MIDISYFKNLTPRQQLNDLMHKYAQVNSLPYGESWKHFDRLFYRRHGVKISVMRWLYCQDHQINITIPAYLETVNHLNLALEIAHEMTNYMMQPGRTHQRLRLGRRVQGGVRGGGNWQEVYGRRIAARHGRPGKARSGLARQARRGEARLGRVGLGSAGEARQGQARLGSARQGMARQARQGQAWLGAVRLGSARYGLARQARPGVVRRGTAGSGKARQARPGMAWRGRQGTVWLGSARYGLARQARIKNNT